MNINKIVVIGNGGGGKTTLLRTLSKKYSFPITHVDSIQYIDGMKTRDTLECMFYKLNSREFKCL